MRPAMLAAFVALHAGCGRAVDEMVDHAPPVVTAEALSLTRTDGVSVYADRGTVTLVPDAGASLQGVELLAGHVRARADQAEGGAAGAWFLSGAVRAWVIGGDGGLTEDAGDDDVPGVEVEAPRMRLDPRSGSATLDGGVRVRRGDMVMEAPRVRVTYTPAGDIAQAAADGPVTVHAGGSTLTTAGGARLDLVRRVLEIPGRVRVVRGPVTLEGDGVTVDLSTGAVELHAVQGRWTVQRP